MIYSYYFSVILTNSLLLLAFVYGVYNRKQILVNEQVRWYLGYLGFLVGIEALVKVLIFFNSVNTSFTYPLYVTGEFLTLGSMMLAAMSLRGIWQLVIIVCSIAIFLEAGLLWWENEFFTPGVGKVFSHLIIICGAAYLLITKLREPETQRPLLLIYASLFFYYTVSLFLFLVMNQLTTLNIAIWTTNNVLSAILYFSSIYLFYRLKKSH